ncbi:MAG: glycosyltransferase family 87 protein [Candidatus Dormiibacterota bacterium]
MLADRRVWWWIGLFVVSVALAIDFGHVAEPIGIDFHTYEAAALVGLQQGWAHIYDQGLVAAAQKQLVPVQNSQPFLSPPTVAWLTAALTPLPYWIAYVTWAAFTFIAFGAALAWAGVSQGMGRWVSVVAALAPWWVLHAVHVGQVVPLVAAGVVVAWRLLRQDKDIAAGIALSLIFLKPNTAFLVPFVLLIAGRYRAFASSTAAGAVVVLIAALALGPHGMSAYVSELRGKLPSGADSLTIRRALGVDDTTALVLRVIVVGAVLATAFRLRRAPGLLIPLGITGSLLASPYLHASDLCLLAAAAWMVWEERPVRVWRVPLGVAWVLASPFLFVSGLSPGLTRWPLIELLLLGALIVTAWRALTGPADLRRRAPA